MFQNVWFNKKKYLSCTTCHNSLIKPSGLITVDKIKYVRPIFYDEHCLECSAPACYMSCPHYVRRNDEACVRFDYGIKHNRHNDLLWNVNLKFREWGKLEARINKGSLSIKEAYRLDRGDKLIANCFKLFCSAFQPKTYSYNKKYDGIRRKKYASIGSASSYVNDFLFQCYYGGQKQFNLIFEIADSSNVSIFKTSFNIKQGFNEELIKLEFAAPEGGLVRLFPENNITAELQIFAADFVQLYDAIPQKPSEKLKCVAWDLDNTVWEGILIESDPDSLSLRENVIDVIKEFDRRGIIQIVVSKNDREAVLPVLERLGIKDYFVYVFANWSPKSSNLFYAARMLNINIDTFALIDDSRFEREEVSSQLPCVRTYAEDNLADLLSLPELSLPITEESAHRRLSYIQEMSRKQVKDEFMGDNVEFIRNCGLQINISHIENQPQFERRLELIKRTNQLNLSAHRYTEDEFKTLLADDDAEAFVVYAKDKFGDYGQVAFLYLRNSADKLLITEFAMSCRVAAKYVENALFAFLHEKYGKPIELAGVKTDRNGVLISSITKAGFIDKSNDKKIRLVLEENADIANSDIVKVEF